MNGGETKEKGKTILTFKNELPIHLLFPFNIHPLLAR